MRLNGLGVIIVLLSAVAYALYIVTVIHGRSRLYDAYPIDLTPQVPQLLDAGVRRLMVDGTLLETDEVGRAVARVRRAVEAAQAGRKPAARLRGATSGCMFVGIS